MPDSRFRIQDSGFQVLDSGFWILDSRFRTPDSGSWIPDRIPGFWVLDSGFWILDSGFRIGLSADSGFRMTWNRLFDKTCSIMNHIVIPDSGFWIPESGFRIWHSGVRVPNSGFQNLDSRSSIPDSGRVLDSDSGFRILDFGFWMTIQQYFNAHSLMTYSQIHRRMIRFSDFAGKIILWQYNDTQWWFNAHEILTDCGMLIIPL